MPAPVRLTDLTIGPAERFDVIIDFAGADGKSFVLNNDAKAPFPDGDDIIPNDVMLFKVTKHLHRRDTSSLPRSLAPVPLLNPSSATKTRDSDAERIGLRRALRQPDCRVDQYTMGRSDDRNAGAGSVEVWRLINITEDAHPIHVHLVQFQILDRQPFDASQYPDRLVFTGRRVRPPANERPAFKDTVKAFPGEVTRIITKFDLPTGTHIRPGDKFRYVLHCHILEHEDNDMMRRDTDAAG